MQMQMQAQQELASRQNEGTPEESNKNGIEKRTDAVLMPQQAQFLTRLALQKKG